MTSLGIRVDHADGGHVTFALFIGPDPSGVGARGKAGDLTMRTEEFKWFRKMLDDAGVDYQIAGDPDEPETAA